MNKQRQFSFEHLCISKETGFSCDVETMLMPSNPSSFDDVVFRLISKIDTSLLLLKTHEEQIENFTIIAIPLPPDTHPLVEHNPKPIKINRAKARVKIPPLKSTPQFDFSAVQNAFECLNGEGWHCLQILALLHPDSIPDNGSRRYSIYQFTTCVMDVIRANYMFQKYRDAFHHETLETFDDADIDGATRAVFGLLWKRVPSVPAGRALEINRLPVIKRKAAVAPSVAVAAPKNVKKSVGQRICNQPSVETTHEPEEDMDIDEEIEEEITFKREKITLTTERETFQEHKSEVPQSLSPKRGRLPSKMDETLQDVTLGFEVSAKIAKAGRKSAVRKSLHSDWPEEERLTILNLYDDLNSDVLEQKRVAFTCKFVLLQMGKDLPSKLLYDWVQKRGREVKKSVTSAAIPEGERQKEAALAFFRTLKEDNSETARVSLTLKYLEIQFGLNLTSKQLFAWLNEKPGKKTHKRR